MSISIMSDDELAEDEEEILVYVEFDGLIADNAFGNEQLHLDMIGIDTEHPIMQINGRFYEGTYEDALGTYILFAKNDGITADDPVFDVPETLKYFAKTRKLLKMQRVFIENRAEVLGDSENSHCIPNIDTIREAGVPMKYQDEALHFWKKLRDYRMDTLKSYLERQKLREEKKAKGIVIDSESDEELPFNAYRDEGQIQKPTSNMNFDPKNIRETESEQPTEIHTTAGNSVLDEHNQENDEHMETGEESINPSTSNNIELDSTSTKKVKKKKLSPIKTKKSKAMNITTKTRIKKGQQFETHEDIVEADQIKQSEELHDDNVQEPESIEATSCTVLPNVPHEREEDMNKLDETNNCQLDTDVPRTVKQLKREAKMQEILERLKALANEGVK